MLKKTLLVALGSGILFTGSSMASVENVDIEGKPALTAIVQAEQSADNMSTYDYKHPAAQPYTQRFDSGKFNSTVMLSLGLNEFGRSESCGMILQTRPSSLKPLFSKTGLDYEEFINQHSDNTSAEIAKTESK